MCISKVAEIIDFWGTKLTLLNWPLWN